jgi:hypothetical protein
MSAKPTIQLPVKPAATQSQLWNNFLLISNNHPVSSTGGKHDKWTCKQVKEREREAQQTIMIIWRRRRRNRNGRRRREKDIVQTSSRFN